jgi:hypothetical protein
MFSAIYVKCYLQPDRKHQTKRRTEEIKLDNPELPITKAHYKSMSHDKEVSLHAVFQPMSFKFSKSLDYNKVTNEMVAERTVEIVVCVIQKYTRRSFMIAKLLLPLKNAVKKLIREKVALRPCLKTNVLEKVQPYPKDVLKVMSNYRLFGGSNPNVRVSPLFLPEEARAVSDSDLKNVTIGSPSEAIVLSLPMEDPSDTDSLQSVSVKEVHSGSMCSVSLEDEPIDSGFEPSPRDSMLSVSPPAKLREMSQKKSKSKVPIYDSVLKGQLDIEGGQGSKVKDALSSAEDGHMTMFDTVEELNLRPVRLSQNSWVSPSSSRSDSPVSYLTSSSRPDTPSWDAYMQPLEITGEIPIDARVEDYHPPMAMSMNLPQILQSFRPVNLQMSKETATLPGQAEFHLENDTPLATEKQTSSVKESAVDKNDGKVKRTVSKGLVPVVGARAARSPPPGDWNANYKTPSYELRHVGSGAKGGPLPGRVICVEPDGAKNEKSETSFVNQVEKTVTSEEASGQDMKRKLDLVGVVEKGRVAETSFSNRGQLNVIQHDTELQSGRPGRRAVPITQLHISPKRSQGTTLLNQAQSPAKPRYEFGEERLTIIEPVDIQRDIGAKSCRPKSNLRSVSPAYREPDSPAKLSFGSLPPRALSPTNRSPTRIEDGATNVRSVSPANWNEMAASKLKSLSNQRCKRPAGLARSTTSDEPTSPTNERPSTQTVDAAKSRLKQKLLLKKQRILKQQEHELLVLDPSSSKPGSVKAVPVNPSDLVSDV